MKIIAALLVLASILAYQKPVMAINTGVTDTTLTIVAPKYYEERLLPLIGAYRSATKKDVNVEYIENADDYRTKMNTEILAGRGPDIFYSDYIPFWDYAKKGMLVDFNKLIENDADVSTDDFYENIIDPLRDEKGRLYAMPCSFMFCMILVNTPMLEQYGMSMPNEWTLQSMFDTAIEFSKRSADNPDVYSMYEMFPSFADSLIKAEGSLAINYNREKPYVEKLPDDLFEYIKKNDDMTTRYGIGWITNETDGGGIYSKGLDKFLFYPQQPELGSIKVVPVRNFIEYDEYEVLPMPRSDTSMGTEFTLYNTFCINKNGNVDEAWSFIKSSLSDEVQNKSSRAIPNPVKKTATEYRFEKMREEVVELLGRVADGQNYTDLLCEPRNKPDELAVAVEHYITSYIENVNKLNEPSLSDRNLSINIDNILALDVNGNIDSIAAKAEIARVVDLYRQELGGDIQKGYTIIYIIGGAVVILLVVAGFVRKKKKIPGKANTKTGIY